MQEEQLPLFGRSLNVDAAIKAAMNQAAKGSHLSRAQLAEKMGDLAASQGFRLNGNARALSTETLEKWLNPLDREHMPGPKAISVFCEVVGSTAPLDAQAMAHGCRVIDRRQALLLERAEVEERIRELQRKKKRIEAEI